MKRLILALACVAGWTPDLLAQNLVVTNARILDGRGNVIDRGSIVVRDGRIVSAAQGAATVPGVRVIDAKGLTVMPGFIDAHRHIISGNAAEWLKRDAAARMQEFLDAGFTTVLSAGDSLQEILELRSRLDRGEIRGPRLVASGRAPLTRAAGGPAGGRGVDPARSDRSRGPRAPLPAGARIPPDEVRKIVQDLASAGVDAIKTNIIVTPGGPEKETLALVVQEATRYRIPVITHAVTVDDTLAAVEAGVQTLVHTPHIGRLDENPAAVQRIAKAGIPMMSTLGVFVPHFRSDNTPIFRDDQPFPWETVSSGGQGPVNARLLWEAGITYGYGTDLRWHPRESLGVELRALGLMFSPRDIVSILTRGAAAAIHRGDQVGTIEPGKLADLVILDGDPLASVSDLMKVAMVIKGGEVVVDKR